MNNFIFNAPAFFNFDKGDDESDSIENGDSFFERNNSLENLQSNQEFYTPLRKTPDPEDDIQTPMNFRKSLSLNDLLQDDNEEDKENEVNNITNAVKNLRLSNKKTIRFSKVCNSSVKKVHSMKTRNDTPRLVLRSRSICKEQFEELRFRKYVSMAEAVNQFQQKTPKRFHSKPKSDVRPLATVVLKTTVPQSPPLATKERARTTHILSQEELELKEIEEMKKFKIRPTVLNSKIFHAPAPLKPCSATKKVTKPEPFNLTEVHKKAPVSRPQVEEFNGKTHKPPIPTIKANLHAISNGHKILKTCHTKDNKHENGKPFQATTHIPVTMPVPFSFEERNKQLLTKKERFIQEVLDQEKKAREFHARPIPKNVFKSPQLKSNLNKTKKHHGSCGSLYKSSDSVDSYTFKAKPAKVLQMEPFQPKRISNYLTMFNEFPLYTERRAKDRLEFDQKLKDREEEFAKEKKIQEAVLLKHEELERAKIRKEAEHKANPIRRYRPLKVVTPKNVTEPKSPNFAFKKKPNDN